jgi:hypothetical protein
MMKNKNLNDALMEKAEWTIYRWVRKQWKGF